MAFLKSITSVALALLLVAVLAAGGAIAQSDATNETDDVQEELEEQEIEERIDDDVVLMDYEYRDGAFHLDVRHTGERPKTVTVVESVQRTEGAGTMSIGQQRLIPGETTIVVDVKRRSGEAAVAISTQDSIDQGRATFVSTGTTTQWFNGSATWGLVFIAVFATGYGMFWGTRRYLEKQQRKQEKRQIEVVR